ncbi:MAG TPA: hypothetical protein VK369_12190, partial [Segetibacter sp.]|nr:hypothetical protein [Segetibacter sp.]
ERKYTDDQIKAFEVLQRPEFIMKRKRKQGKASAISIAFCVGIATEGRAKKWVCTNQKILPFRVASPLGIEAEILQN